MIYKLEIREEAYSDIDQSFAYYEKRQRGLGEKFLGDLDLSLQYVIKAPENFLLKRNQYREVVLRKFPYVVTYKIERDKIIIFSVFNTHQDPSKKL